MGVCMNVDRRTLLLGAGLSMVGLPALAAGREAPEFVGIEGWINSPPLTMRGLRGRPVLVTFFARTCINCIRTMPYVESWYRRYHAQGFVVVGVHTPEFESEKPRAALETAVSRFGLSYPIAQDNASATWNAWANQYWPADYLVDRHGQVVYSHVGEGDYADIEGRIRALSA